MCTSEFKCQVTTVHNNTQERCAIVSVAVHSSRFVCACATQTVFRTFLIFRIGCFNPSPSPMATGSCNNGGCAMRKPHLILLLWSLLTFSNALAWTQSPKWTRKRRKLAALYLSKHVAAPNTLPADSTRRQALVHQLLWTFSFPSVGSCDTDMEEPPQCKDGAIISGKCDELRKAMLVDLNRPRLSQLEPCLIESAVPGAYQQVCMTLPQRTIMLKVCTMLTLTNQCSFLLINTTLPASLFTRVVDRSSRFRASGECGCRADRSRRMELVSIVDTTIGCSDQAITIIMVRGQDGCRAGLWCWIGKHFVCQVGSLTSLGDGWQCQCSGTDQAEYCS
jgi:hypothetical protein